MQYRPDDVALKPLILALEKKRKLYHRAYERACYLHCIPLVLFFILTYLSLKLGISLLWSFVVCIGFFLLIQYKKVVPPQDEYKKAYKEDLIQPFVQLFFPKVSYLPGTFSTSNNIQASFLYENLGSYAALACEDGFRGKTNQDLDFTVMKASYRVDLHGKMETKQEIFISIVLPNKGYQPVIVGSGTRIKHTLKRYNKKQELEAGEEVLIVPQTEFEADLGGKYKVYSQKLEDAKALLTEPFLSLIQKLEEQWRGTIRFSFVNDVLHIALPLQEHFFEGDLKQTVSANTVGQKLFKELATCLTVVEHLSASLYQLELPSPKTKNLDLPTQNWDNSAYDHFIDHEF